MRHHAPALVLAACVIGAAVHAQPKQTFRATTRLVEVSVVVTDKQGTAVSGLTLDDFTLTEDRVRQTISIFQETDDRAGRPLADASASAGEEPAAPTGAASTFSNKLTGSGAVPTVILLDRLNGSYESQWYARKHIDQYLAAMRVGDRVALYAIDGSVHVLHDFSSDSASLRRALERYQARTSAAYDASNEAPAASPEGGLSVWLADPTASTAEFFAQRRSNDTFAYFRVIAGHLAGVAGRKNLVWVSEAFPVPSRDGRLEFLAHLRLVTEALSDAQVALFPIDTRGLMGAITLNSGRAGFTTFAMARGNVDTMQVVAEETGGRAFYNTNALDTSIRRAVDDSRAAYLLAYYPTDAKSDSRFRAIDVSLKRKGLIVRHRRGYVAAPPPATDLQARNAALTEALQSPLQASGLGLTAQAAFTGTGQLEVAVRIDPSTLALERDGDVWRGAVDLLIAEVSVRGRGTVGASTQLDLTLPEAARATATREGLAITRTIATTPRLFQLRVVVRDVRSGRIGSLLIPAAELRR